MEKKHNDKSSYRKFYVSPLFVAIIAGIFAILGTFIGGFLNFGIEKKRQEGSMILEAIKLKDENKRTSTLLFLANLSFIDLSQQQIKKLKNYVTFDPKEDFNSSKTSDTIDQATSRFGVTLGWQLARYEFIYDSTYPEARNAKPAAKRDIEMMLRQDKFPYDVDSLDYQQIVSTILLHYGSSNPEKHSTVLLGIAAMRASLIGASANQENNDELLRLAYSAIQDIDNNIIKRKHELFIQILLNKPKNVSEVLALLNKVE